MKDTYNNLHKNRQQQIELIKNSPTKPRVAPTAISSQLSSNPSEPLSSTKN